MLRTNKNYQLLPLNNWFVISLLVSSQVYMFLHFTFLCKYEIWINSSIHCVIYISIYIPLIFMSLCDFLEDFDKWIGRCLLCLHKIITGWLHFFFFHQLHKKLPITVWAFVVSLQKNCIHEVYISNTQRKITME